MKNTNANLYFAEKKSLTSAISDKVIWTKEARLSILASRPYNPDSGMN